MAVGTRHTVAGLVLVSVMALAVAPAAAADGPKPEQPSSTADGRDEASDAVRREAEDLSRFRVGTVRARLHWPLQVAGGAGILVGHRPASWDCATVCEFRGFHAQGEIGLGGAQVAAGWASLVGETTSSSHWISSVFSGWAVRGALMRTGGNSTLTPEWQTFAGFEGTLSATRGSLSLAVYHRISDTPSKDSWLIGAGLGWGF